MNATISVLIVHYNSADLLRECLRSVYASTDAEELEVIVVDNASDWFPLEDLSREFPEVTWRPQPINTTCTGGNNIALRAASGDTLLMLNPDTRVERDTIVNAARHLHDSPELVAVGARLLDEDGRLQRRYYRRLPRFGDIPVLLFEPLFRKTRRGRQFLMSDEAFHGKTLVEHAAGVFLLMRRKDLPGWLLEPGYFNLLSDLALSRQLGTVGQVAVFDDVRCYHVGGGGGMVTRNVSRQLVYHHDFTWGLRRYFRGHLNMLQRAGLEAMLAAYWITRIARVAVANPAHAIDAVRVGSAALTGRVPHY